MRRVQFVSISCVLCGVAFFLGHSEMKGQDQPKKAAAQPAAKSSGSGDVVQQWADLEKKKEEFLATVNKLQKDFQTADDNGKKEIVAAFQKLQADFYQNLRPEMIKLAPQVLAKDPLNVTAAEAVAGQAFQENRYAQVNAIVDKLIAGGKSSPALLNVGGVSSFAIHDFAKAQQLLTRASQEAKTDEERGLFENLGARFLGACSDYMEFWKQEQAIREKEAKANDLPQVVFKTNKGDIVLELFENEAPNTVANFVSLVEGKKYDGTLFHRVIPNFMAQGGDPNSLDENPNNDGQGGPGYKIACECYAANARKHFQGSLSMAHAGKDSGGSQFFLTHLPTPHLNPSAEQQRGHTVFGRITKGMDVAAAIVKGDKIESAKVLRKRSHPYVPKKASEGN